MQLAYFALQWYKLNLLRNLQRRAATLCTSTFVYSDTIFPKLLYRYILIHIALLWMYRFMNESTDLYLFMQYKTECCDRLQYIPTDPYWNHRNDIWPFETTWCFWIMSMCSKGNSEGSPGISLDQLSGSNEPVWLQAVHVDPNRHPTFGLFPCLGKNKNVEPQGVCELRSHFAGSIWRGWLGSPLTNYRVVTSPFDFKRPICIPTDTPLLVYFHVWVKIKM